MSFAAPLFLLAALAGLIPILLHMMNQQKARPVPFSTLRFLKLSVQRTRSWKYLQDVVLLMLRVAALVLVALALAKPTITGLGRLLGPRASSAVVLILDNSASMSTVDQGGSRWQAAVQAAETLMDQLRDGDWIALSLTGGPPRTELDRLYQNHEVIRQALDECRVSAQQADLPQRIRAAEALLADNEAANKEIYVVTDLQAACWRSLPVEPAAPSDATAIVLVNVGRTRRPNAAVTDVRLQSAAPVVGLPVQARVGLQGDLSVSQQRRIELVLDGKVLQTSPAINLPVGGLGEHVFQFSVDQPGLHRGEVRLADEDACSSDDRRYFALSVQSHISVAVVKVGGSQIPYLDDAYYLERALAPVVAGEWAIRTTTLRPSALDRQPLAKFAVVFCVNLPGVDEAAAQQLCEYVRRGGHLVWICGDEVVPTVYNALNLATDNELLPAQLIGVREAPPEQPEGWRVGWLDAKHPTLKPLTAPESLYQSVQVFRLLESKPAEGSRVLARLDSGVPLLTQRSVGTGDVFLLSTSVHVDWSNLPLRPIFLPLIAGLTFHLAEAEASQPQLVAGTPLSAPAPPAGAVLEVLPPSGETIRLETDDKQADVRFADTYEPGIYELISTAPAQRSNTAFALNLDAREVAPETLPLEKIQAGLGERPFVACSGPGELSGAMRTLREGESLWDAFLAAVLVALIAEALMANRRVEREHPADLAVTAQATRGARHAAPVRVTSIRVAAGDRTSHRH